MSKDIFCLRQCMYIEKFIWRVKLFMTSSTLITCMSSCLDTVFCAPPCTFTKLHCCMACLSQMQHQTSHQSSLHSDTEAQGRGVSYGCIFAPSQPDTTHTLQILVAAGALPFVTNRELQIFKYAAIDHPVSAVVLSDFSAILAP